MKTLVSYIEEGIAEAMSFAKDVTDKGELNYWIGKVSAYNDILDYIEVYYEDEGLSDSSMG